MRALVREQLAQGLRFTVEVVRLSMFGIGLMVGIAASYVRGTHRPEPDRPGDEVDGG